jgi:signal transduction histidine kinase
MQMEYTPFAVPYVISGVITLMAADLAWARRGRPGSTAIGLFMVALSVWSLGSAAEHCSVTLQGKLFWGNVQYIGITTAPVAWLAMAIGFSGRQDVLTKRKVTLLLAMSAVFAILSFTNPYHSWMSYGVHLDVSGPLPVVAKEYGWAFRVMVFYNYFLILLGLLAITRTVFGLPNPYRGQGLLALVGVSVPCVYNIVYLIGQSPLPNVDFTPVSFALSGIVTIIAILRYYLLDIRPIALSAVVEGMDSGVAVVGAEGLVVYANPAARRMVRLRTRDLANVGPAQLLQCWPEAAAALKDMMSHTGDQVVDVRHGDDYYEIRVSTLFSQAGALVGKTLVINDITERVQSQDQRLRDSVALTAHQQRELLARELHDNIGQTLGYLNVQLQATRENLIHNGGASVEEDLTRLVEVVRETYSDLRQHIVSMMGNAALRFEFRPKLLALLDGLEQRSGVRIDLAMPADFDEHALGNEAGFQILRIIQEACTNAVKHASAGKLTVKFETVQGLLQVSVKDDGCGFNPAVQQPGKGNMGLGIGIMRERAESLGGDLAVVSAPGKGTEVRVCIPLQREEEANSP